MSPRDGSSVRRVAAALEAAGATAEVIELASSARTAREAATSLGVARGAIVKSLVFTIDGEAVMALIAGDRRCAGNALPAALGREGRTERADAGTVRAATGFAIGGVAPLGHLRPLPIAIDASLGRFGVLYAAAGHPHCVFATSLNELARLTGGHIAADIACP